MVNKSEIHLVHKRNKERYSFLPHLSIGILSWVSHHEPIEDIYAFVDDFSQISHLSGSPIFDINGRLIGVITYALNDIQIHCYGYLYNPSVPIMEKG